MAGEHRFRYPSRSDVEAIGCTMADEIAAVER
jgi:hypothetical protein